MIVDNIQYPIVKIYYQYVYLISVNNDMFKTFQVLIYFTYNNSILSHDLCFDYIRILSDDKLYSPMHEVSVIFMYIVCI